jgi:hypothetical protein
LHISYAKIAKEGAKPRFGHSVQLPVQLSERKNGFLTPKRHQIKHLQSRWSLAEGLERLRVTQEAAG